MLYRSLALALFAATAVANPVPEGTDACSTVRCKGGYQCEVIDGKAECVPNEGGEQCGAAICGDGEYCCNDSCSICSPIGDMCTAQICQPEGPECGSTTCHEGFECCNPSCGMCVRPGMACTQQVCEPDGPEPVPVPDPVQCGPNVCDAGVPCCNESCGICGDVCTEQYCFEDGEEPEEPEGEQCGNNTCSSDEYCCNESCSMCAKQGDGCTKQFCADGEKP